MEIKNLIEVVEYLEKVKSNPTFPLTEMHKWYNFALDELKDIVVQTAFENRKEMNHKNLRYAYEDRIQDSGRYDWHMLSEVDDWEQDRLREQFLEFIGTDDSTSKIYDAVMMHKELLLEPKL